MFESPLQEIDKTEIRKKAAYTGIVVFIYSRVLRKSTQKTLDLFICRCILFQSLTFFYQLHVFLCFRQEFSHELVALE